MKDCFLKLHKVDKSTMDKIVSVALAEHDWNNFADTYSSFDENGVRKSPRYVSTISQGIFDTWNENMQFISDLVLPKELEPYTTITAMNKIPPNYEFGAHTDTYRECCLYLPIYPVKDPILS